MALLRLPEKNTPKANIKQLSKNIIFIFGKNFGMNEIKIYPLIGLVIGIEYLDNYQQDPHLRSVEFYLLILAISFNWRVNGV